MFATIATVNTEKCATCMCKILSSFRRPLAAGSAYIAELDGLRFVAITWVVFGHLDYVGNYQFPLWIEAFLDASKLGVQLFFVISGYVISRPFIRAQPNLKDYYIQASSQD